MNKGSALLGKKLLVIGAGSIAEAMVRGLTGGHAMEAGHIFVTNRTNRERLSSLEKTYGIIAVPGVLQREADAILAESDIILLACKPHDVPRVLETLHEMIHHQVVISVAAGISTSLINSILGEDVQVVRAMPNTSCAVLESATALSFGKSCGEDAKLLAEEIMSVLGTVSVVKEKLMDAVTGVSGSGPAYFYYMVEAMQQAAESLGLDSETARTLILQTLFGAGKMMQETGLDAKELRRQVTSPNGTTMAGIRVLEQADFKETIERVITRATERSREMGEQQESLLN